MCSTPPQEAKAAQEVVYGAPAHVQALIPTPAGQKYGGYLRSLVRYTRTLVDKHMVPTEIKTNQKPIIQEPTKKIKSG